MNQGKPVQLYQKVQFLHQKIDFMHTQVKNSGLFELKMKFIDFIDTSIEKVVLLDNKNKYSSEVVNRKYQQYYHAQQNEREKNRIQQEKQTLSKRIAQLAEKEKDMQIQSLRLQLENGRILKDKMSHQYSNRELQLKGYMFELQKKLKAVEKELEKVVKMNSAQAKEIQALKEQRNKAQKRELQWRQKYDNEIGILQTFSNKKSKYVFRDQEGLRIYRTITNATNAIKGCERLLLCDIPLKFHVAKIVYGIKIGQMQSNREIQYFKQISLYQKEQMVMTIEDGHLRLEYLKRKVVINLDKYELINKNQVIIMLFGKGDSIAIDQSK